ncbi:hypothetical protein BGX21_004757, partial [Mortierella sp. AD011]
METYLAFLNDQAKTKKTYENFDRSWAAYALYLKTILPEGRCNRSRLRAVKETKSDCKAKYQSKYRRPVPSDHRVNKGHIATATPVQQILRKEVKNHQKSRSRAKLPSHFALPDLDIIDTRSTEVQDWFSSEEWAEITADSPVLEDFDFSADTHSVINCICSVQNKKVSNISQMIDLYDQEVSHQLYLAKAQEPRNKEKVDVLDIISIWAFNLKTNKSRLCSPSTMSETEFVIQVVPILKAIFKDTDLEPIPGETTSQATKEARHQ